MTQMRGNLGCQSLVLGLCSVAVDLSRLSTEEDPVDKAD